MSWDALIVKTTDPNFTKPAETAAQVSLGTAGEVKAKLAGFVPSVVWDGTRGHALVGRLSLEINLLPATLDKAAVRPFQPPSLANTDEVGGIGVSARGEGDPVTLVTQIAKANRWSVADAQAGSWMDLNAPSQKSLKEFSEYRNEVFGDKQGPESQGGTVGVNLLISVAFFVAVTLLVRLLPK